MNVIKVPVGRRPKPALKIAIDAGSLSDQLEQHTGTATIVETLIQEIIRWDRKNRYILYSFAPISRSLFAGSSHVTNKVLPRMGFKNIWMPLAFRRDKPDAFIALSQVMPKGAPPTIGFIYDIAFIKYPRMYKNRDELKANTQELIRQAQHMVTLSDAAQTDILKRFDIKLKHISVVYPGVRTDFVPKGPRIIDTKPFFMYVGGLRPTKNIPKLLEAFFYFKKNNPQYRLLIIGESVHPDPEILATLERYKLKSSVIFKKNIRTEDLPKYYRGAQALLQPSLYEGFGLPVIEAMACGCPVIVNNASSLPEIVGKAGVVVEMRDPTAVAKSMEKLVHDRRFRTTRVKLGLKEMKRFDSRRFAKEVIDLVYKYCV